MLLGLCRYIPGLLLAAGAVPAVADSGEVRAVDRPWISVADVVDLTALDAASAQQIGAYKLGELHPGEVTRFDPQQIRTALERGVPGFVGHLVQDGAVLTFVHRPMPQPAASVPCLRLLRPFEPGEAVLRSDVQQASNCGDTAQTLTYSAVRGGFNTVTALPVGAPLDLASSNVLPLAAKDQSLKLLVRTGPVQVSRDVTLIQPVYDSGTVLVRTSDGIVVTAEFSEPVVQP